MSGKRKLLVVAASIAAFLTIQIFVAFKMTSLSPSPSVVAILSAHEDTTTPFLYPEQVDDTLAAWLQLHITRPFVFVPNPGNIGDALIFLGMLQLFQRLSLPTYTKGSPSEEYNNEILVYAGGGNLVEEVGYTTSADFLSKNHHPEKNNTVVLLPHSVRGFKSLIESLGSNVWLWARESPSFEYMKATAIGGAHVQLSHDLAFYTVINFTKIRSFTGKENKNKKLYAFRKDKEAPEGQSIPVGNVDVASPRKVHPEIWKQFTLDAPQLSEEQLRNVTDLNDVYGKYEMDMLQRATLLLRIVGSRPKVYTNRLHVSVASAIMQTPCDVYDNSYGKISGVYNQSLCSNCAFEYRGKSLHLAKGLFSLE